MIIEPHEVDAFERFIEQEMDLLTRYRQESIDDLLLCMKFQAFFASNPHLPMPPLGFDECQVIKRQHCRRGLAPTPANPPQLFSYPVEEFYRRRESEEWLWLEGLTDSACGEQGEELNIGEPFLHLKTGEEFGRSYDGIADLPTELRKIVGSAHPEYHQLAFPRAWSKQSKYSQRLLLGDAVRDILQKVSATKKDLQSLRSLEFEWLVVESLSSLGMQVSAVEASDGSRDIIARGELLPGKAGVFAVSLHQNNVEGLSELERKLRANERRFPAVMVASLAHLSAGVLVERNQLRLFLKTGVALGQWFSGWATRRAADWGDWLAK